MTDRECQKDCQGHDMRKRVEVCMKQDKKKTQRTQSEQKERHDSRRFDRNRAGIIGKVLRVPKCWAHNLR